MIDQQALERMPCGSPHVSSQIDGLSDLVREGYAFLGVTVTTSSVALTTKVFYYLITKAPEHPAVQNMTETLDQAVLSVVLNRSPKSMTQHAKDFNITKQAFSKRVMSVTDRLGLPVRSQKSDKARLAYDQRARRHHDKRRREAKPWNTGAFMKGLKCKHSKK